MDKRKRKVCACACAAAGLALLSFPGPAAAGGAFSLVPRPNYIREGEGAFRLRPDTKILYSDEAVRQPAEFLCARLRAATGYGLPAAAFRKAAYAGPGEILFSLSPVKAYGEEGYYLEARPEGVTIRAAAGDGAFWGMQTFLQLLPAEAYAKKPAAGVVWEAPAAVVRDRPAMRWRGFMLDCSRQFFAPEAIKRVLDNMAAMKMNRFHWHLIDDNGWRLEIKGYPRLTSVGATQVKTGYTRDPTGAMDYPDEGKTLFYSQETVRDLVAYAHERHIVIVPEFELPGHCTAGIASYPELLVCDNQLLGSGPGFEPDRATTETLTDPADGKKYTCLREMGMWNNGNGNRWNTNETIVTSYSTQAGPRVFEVPEDKIERDENGGIPRDIHGNPKYQLVIPEGARCRFEPVMIVSNGVPRQLVKNGRPIYERVVTNGVYALDDRGKKLYRQRNEYYLHYKSRPMCVNSERSNAFRRAVFEQIFRLFPKAPWIHLGGDEVGDSSCWAGCPACLALKEAYGGRRVSPHAALLGKLREKVLAPRGRGLIVWNDAIGGLVGLGVDGVVQMNWNGGYASSLLGLDAGYRIIEAPIQTSYFDYVNDAGDRQASVTGQTLASSKASRYVTLKKVYRYDPDAGIAPWQRRLLLGTQAALWTASVHTEQEMDFLAFPRLCAIAERSWTDRANKSYEDFLFRLDGHYARMALMEASYRPEAPEIHQLANGLVALRAPAGAQAEIHYSFGDDEPTAASPVYAGPVAPAGGRIRAVTALKPGFFPHGFVSPKGSLRPNGPSLFTSRAADSKGSLRKLSGPAPAAPGRVVFVKTSAEGPGAGTVSSDKSAFAAGEDALVSIAPKPGSRIRSVLVNGRDRTPAGDGLRPAALPLRAVGRDTLVRVRFDRAAPAVAPVPPPARGYRWKFNGSLRAENGGPEGIPAGGAEIRYVPGRKPGEQAVTITAAPREGQIQKARIDLPAGLPAFDRDWTVSAWIKRSPDPKGKLAASFLLSDERNGLCPVLSRAWNNAKQQDFGILLRSRNPLDPDAEEENRRVYRAALPTDAFTMLTFVQEAADGMLRAYTNGAPAGFVWGPMGKLPLKMIGNMLFDNSRRFGKHLNNSGRDSMLRAALDDLIVLPYALKPGQVARLYRTDEVPERSPFEVVSVGRPDVIELGRGARPEEIPLPCTLPVTLDTGKTLDVPVDWGEVTAGLLASPGEKKVAGAFRWPAPAPANPRGLAPAAVLRIAGK